MFLILRPPLHKNFLLPTRDDLLGLKAGSSVKIIFSAGEEVERMWVTLTDNSDTDKWEGELDNEPTLEGMRAELKVADKVTFHPFDIIQIYKNS